MRCAAGLDFTSALYLGLQHPGRTLPAWPQLTTGRPAALGIPLRQRQVSTTLARLVGCERALLSPSTLHLFWDLFGLLGGADNAIYMDDGLYPIARWGIERAACRGIPVRRFAHYRIASLRRQLQQDSGQSHRPIVVADGFCPGCGRPAPLHALLELIAPRNGLLVLDDTQALGILGREPSSALPYGSGGGGSLRFHAAEHRNVLLISSLAKGFGVPVAALCGPDTLVQGFEARSVTRTHCSPPSLAVIHATAQALGVNRMQGDTLRARLARNVVRLGVGLSRAGYTTQTGNFPVRTLAHQPEIDMVALHTQLLRDGIRTVLHHARADRSARVSFLLTARHTPAQIDAATETLLRVSRSGRLARTAGISEVTYGTVATGRRGGL